VVGGRAVGGVGLELKSDVNRRMVGSEAVSIEAAALLAELNAVGEHAKERLSDRLHGRHRQKDPGEDALGTREGRARVMAPSNDPETG